MVADINPNKTWCPSTYTAFKVLLSARLCAAVWSNISDCDEVFNYWEPVRKYLFFIYLANFLKTSLKCFFC